MLITVEWTPSQITLFKHETQNHYYRAEFCFGSRHARFWVGWALDGYSCDGFLVRISPR